jgi:DNA-binding CsgD family transcriptional regulator
VALDGATTLGTDERSGRRAVDPMTTPDPPEETVAFFDHVRSMVTRRDPALRFLGMSEQAGRALADLASSTRSSVLNMQRRVHFYSLRDGRALTVQARARGVEMQMIVSPSGLPMSPIASSYMPYLRLGPVSQPLMILDSRFVIVPGIDQDSLWTSADQDVVDHAIRAYEAVDAVSRPALADGEDPPLTPRMVDIAWLLADGASDRQISRELGISERTVSNEVREIGRRLGTSNRAHTIARICGAPA